MLIHVIDFEGSLKCGIIEYGILTLNGSAFDSAYTGLCLPDAPVDPKDVLLHGLRNEELKGHPSFCEFREFFYGLRGNGVLAAHHAPVENSFLNRYWNVVPVNDGCAVRSTGSWGPWVDSRLVAQAYHQTDDYSLGNLIVELELEDALEGYAQTYCPAGRRKPHCALYDAIASALIILKFQMERRLSVDSLIRCSQSQSDRRTLDFAQEEFL